MEIANNAFNFKQLEKVKWSLRQTSESRNVDDD